MSLFISIFIGGGMGALTRYVLIEQINKSFASSFPYGTLTVNVIGAFLIGLAWSYFADKINISDDNFIKIKCITFKEVISITGNVDLIKIDIEGAEYKIYRDLLKYSDKFKEGL